MKLFNITDKERLYKFLDECTGDLRISLPDGQEYEWKQDRERVVRAIGDAATVENVNIRLGMQSNMDSAMLVKYMMESVAC